MSNTYLFEPNAEPWRFPEPRQPERGYLGQLAEQVRNSPWLYPSEDAPLGAIADPKGSPHERAAARTVLAARPPLGRTEEQEASQYDPRWGAAEIALNALPVSGRALKLGAAGLGGLVAMTDPAEAGKANFWSKFSKIAQPSDVREMEFALRPRGKMAEHTPIAPTDLPLGSRLLPLAGDRTLAGYDLTGIGGNKFADPTVLQGGPGYMRMMHPEAVWANDKGAASRLISRAEAERGPVYGVTTAMGERSGDFSHHVSDTLMSMVDHAKLTREGARHFNQHMLAIDPSWPGVNSSRAKDWLSEAPGRTRAAFAKLMDQAPYREGGFPRVDEARFATTDPALRDVRTGSSGASVGTITGRRAEGVPEHFTFPSAMEGKYRGSLGNVPFDVMFPDLAKGYLKVRPDMRKMTPDQLDAAYVSMAMHGPRGVSPTQPVNQRWVDTVSKYIEDQSKLGEIAAQDRYRY